MSHISCVQTVVKASGKKSSKVFFLPKLLLSFTSTRPDACFDLRVKSGALVPTGNGIIFGFDFEYLISDFQLRKGYMTGHVRCQITIWFLRFPTFFMSKPSETSPQTGCLHCFRFI